MQVCLIAQTITYLAGGGGHFWVFLNWALGLQSNQLPLVWLETVNEDADPEQTRQNIVILRSYLKPYGLDSRVAFIGANGKTPDWLEKEGIAHGEVFASDLLINFRYGLPLPVLKHFRRTALVDIDPGLMQHWIHHGQLKLSPHDIYFTTGHGIGKPGSRIPDLGLKWNHTRPCVSVRHWPVVAAAPGASFTTLSHWHADEYVSEGDSYYDNTKRAGFLPFLDLPGMVSTPLELALCLHDDDPDNAMIRSKGWRLIHSFEPGATPVSYQRYIQESAGEFAACKPSCVRMQNGWVSDRTLCYLASGKPAVVRHTGDLGIDPKSGFRRFDHIDDAAREMRSVVENYPEECHAARKIAEQYFDATMITRQVVETAAQ